MTWRQIDFSRGHSVDSLDVFLTSFIMPQTSKEFIKQFVNHTFLWVSSLYMFVGKSQSNISTRTENQ